MKEKATDYYVASGSSPRALERTVKEYLREGWQPQGGMAVNTNVKGDDYYFQALVRYE